MVSNPPGQPAIAVEQERREDKSALRKLRFPERRSDSPSVFGFHDTQQFRGQHAVNWLHRFTQRMFRTSICSTAARPPQHPVLREPRKRLGRGRHHGQQPGTRELGSADSELRRRHRIAHRCGSLAESQPDHAGSPIPSFGYARHNLTFGTDFRRQQFNLLSQQNPRGTFTFTGAATGSDFADFLLGIPDTSAIAFGNADKYFRASLTTPTSPTTGASVPASR